MYTVKIKDINANNVSIGDTVRIHSTSSLDKGAVVYCEVKYNEEDKSIFPFNVFTMHSVEKVATPPEDSTIGYFEGANVYFPPLEKEKAYKGSLEFFNGWVKCRRKYNEQRIWFFEKIEDKLILCFQDSHNKPIKEGDFIKVYNNSSFGNTWQYYCEFKYITEQDAFSPLHTACFSHLEKIDSIPETATKSSEEIFSSWSENIKDNNCPFDCNDRDYVMSSRGIEVQMEKVFMITGMF